MATVEFKAHLDDDGGIVEYGLQNIVFDRYEMPDGPGVVVSAADKFINEHLMLMSQKLAGEVFYSTSIFVNGEYVCAFRQLNFAGAKAYRFIEVPGRFRTVRELKRHLDPDVYDFHFIEADGSPVYGNVPPDTVYDGFLLADYGNQSIVLVFFPDSDSDYTLAQTMQNFAELTDEFNDFCDTMLEGLRG